MRNLLAWFAEPQTITMPRWQKHIVGGTLVGINLWCLMNVLSLLAWLVLP